MVDNEVRKELSVPHAANQQPSYRVGSENLALQGGKVVAAGRVQRQELVRGLGRHPQLHAVPRQRRAFVAPPPVVPTAPATSAHQE